MAETRSRTRPPLRRMALATTAGIAMTMIPAMGTAGAETFTDPNDRCLPDAVAPPAPITDRDAIAPVHIPSVDCLFAQGIAVGFTDNTYGPSELTRRDQMASFIVNALRAAGYELPPSEDVGFTDIEGNAHEDNIQILALTGVTNGTTPTTYSPNEFVRRDQMATFLVQAAEFAFGTEGFEAIEVGNIFSDVAPANVHYDEIQSGANVLGLVAGRENGMYNPDEPVNRQQMASFLVRLVDLTLIVE